MGTTLSNGVYLPDEGERNCYAGLKVNWEILNQKVADIRALQLAIAGALHREIVASLPTTDIDPNTIYMILSGTSATENVYNEYMYVNNAWELIGTSATDLTNYYTKAEVDGKLLLKANASDLTSHTGDTTIHVTASDKTKWTNSANTHVLRLALSALTPSTSDNSFSNLDDSTALKVGDKVMDTAGVLFEVTAIDTANSTFTIGTALIDLAQDSDVVHKTGDETIGGNKTFTSELTASRNTSNGSLNLQNLSYDPKTNGQSAIASTKSFSINALTSTSDLFSAVSFYGVSDKTFIRFTARYYTDSQNFYNDSLEYTLYGDGTKSFRPRNNNNTTLGESSRKWQSVYATNYYYGSNNVEFSTKFVTTDTNQIISGAKTFSDSLTIYNNDSSQNTKNLTISSSKIQVGDTSNSDSFGIVFNAGLSYVSRIMAFKDTSGTQNLQFHVRTKDSSNNVIGAMIRLRSYANGFNSFESDGDNLVSLGSSSNKWKNVQTYQVNSLEPSSLSLPSSNASDVIDISSYLVNLDGTVNTYTAPANGWISIAITGTAIAIVSSSWSDSRLRETSGNVRMLYPVLKNETLGISVIGTTLDYARFIPCQGNV